MSLVYYFFGEHSVELLTQGVKNYAFVRKHLFYLRPHIILTFDL